MNVSGMRLADRWLGVPVCFLLTLIRRLGDILRRRPAQVRRILFVKLAEQGSTGEGTGRVHGYNANGLLLLAKPRRDFIGEGAFPRAGRASYAQHMGSSGVRINGTKESKGLGVLVFHQCNEPGHGPNRSL